MSYQLQHIAPLFFLVLLASSCSSTRPPAHVPPPLAYKALTADLTRIIDREVETKGLPALSIALVDGDEIVWARGWGEGATGEPADAGTVYRVGSISKLFTDIAVMQLVENGALDLDAPITEYLPDFQPQNPSGRPLTMRQLMSHRSGLVREPPVGNYFDPGEPSLEDTVRSLHATKLVYEPTTRTKYSNAALAVVGRVLEKLRGKPHAECVEETILRPLGMTRSDFRSTAAIRRHLAKAVMWTYDGREFPAPGFRFGMSPAGDLYSTVVDQVRFIRSLFPDASTRVIRQSTLEDMWTVQFEPEGTKRGFGLGFFISDFDGHRRVSHGGAVYGFSTSFAALPDERLGVIVVSSRDVTNNVVGRIASHALRALLARRSGAPSPVWTWTDPLRAEDVAKLVGAWTDGSQRVELADGGKRVYLRQGWTRSEVRRVDGGFLVDGRGSHGSRLELAHEDEREVLRIDGESYHRVPIALPPECPERWRALVGEYGEDHNTLFILEKEGQLHALIEWVFLYPLTEESPNVFAFPESGGLYHGERLVFERGGDAVATRVVAAGVSFTRRSASETLGESFRIDPIRPVEEIRVEAMAATPPEKKGPLEGGAFRESSFVELRDIEPGIRYDIRYASTNNFMGTVFYREARALLQEPAARALARVHAKLAEHGYGLLVHDAYRPWFVTKMFWDATPDSKKQFVADPERGSRHNRGCAVDLTLYSLETGKPIPMPSGYDEFTERAFPLYPGGTSQQRWHRELLRTEMQSEGFRVYRWEWWHFDYRDWQTYPLHHLPFDEILPRKKDA